MNEHAAYGAGRNRDPWMIRKFLAGQGLKQVDVARALDRNPSTINRTIKGAINNRAVLGYLRDLGCPEKYLSLPADMKDCTNQDKKQVA